MKFANTNQVGGEFDSLFFQDNVKLSPNLSINAGLRWEFRRWATDKHDNYVTLVPGSQVHRSRQRTAGDGCAGCTERRLLRQRAGRLSDQQQRPVPHCYRLLSVVSWGSRAVPRKH